MAIRVTNDALRQVRSGHPWVYDGAITSGDEPGTKAGDLAVIFDPKRRFAAIGLWDPTSPIRIRILHHGRPQAIDETFWRDRIVAALDRRQSLIEDHRSSTPSLTGWRCLHGENDGLPGLVADRYDTTLVIRLDTPAWRPHLHVVQQLLMEALAERGVPVERVIERASRRIDGGQPGRLVLGPPVDGPVHFLENGLELEADVERGQKTGHFLDQRDNRARVRALSADAAVLDVFSCTGGFSVNAAAGGARSVVSVDQSRRALDAARRIMARNALQTDGCDHSVICGDAFEVMDRLASDGARFDVVVIDPPSFASKQADVDAGLSAYRRLASLGARLTNEGGTLVQASCSSRIDGHDVEAAIEDGVGRVGAHLDVIDRTGHAVDHPIGFVHGAYLKAVFGTVTSGTNND